MLKKAAIILFPLIIGFISSLFINIDLNSIVLPPYIPSASIFPIVWSILYLLMGYSLYLVFDSNKCIISFIAQFFLNITWSFIFFNFSLFGLGVIWLILLIFFVNNMLLTFILENKKAVYLNMPYFIWLLIAFYLSVGIYILN